MGTFYVGCRVQNHRYPQKSAVVPKLLVDSGSEFTWISSVVLEKIGVEPVKKAFKFKWQTARSSHEALAMLSCAWINSRRLTKWYLPRRVICRCWGRERWTG